MSLPLAPLLHPPKPPRWMAGVVGVGWQLSAGAFLRRRGHVDLITSSCPPGGPALSGKED